MSALRQRIETARERLRSGRFSNEASISTGIVLPLLDALGWDAFDPNEVAPEYKVRQRRVDFALVTKGRPAVFVEVKQPGNADGADRQLFEYAFMEGVPLAVLTDGATWSVYVPAEQGSMEERRAYLLDLAERPPAESADRLRRYLERDAVETGDAFERARRDCQRAKQRRGAQTAIPQAWANLVASRDAAVLDRLAAEVESASGYQPEADDLAAFLDSLRPASGPLPKGKRAAPSPSRTSRPQPPPAERDGGLPSRGFELNGEFVPASSGADLLAKALAALAHRDPTFLERFAAKTIGKSRRLLADSPEALYPGKPEFHRQVREVRDGWLVATHSSSAAKQALIEKAAAEAGLTFGRDLRVRFEK